MTDSDGGHAWTRRDDESTPAYGAFRTYLTQGADRSTANTAREVGKSKTQMDKWSALYGWVERARAYDSYLMTVETDHHAEKMAHIRAGRAEELARIRTRHTALADKLLDHLDKRLDSFIELNRDPSSGWTQAFSAGTKAQESATRMHEHHAESGVLEQILAKIQRFESE